LRVLYKLPQTPLRFPEIFPYVACISLFSLEAVFAQTWHGDAFRYIAPQLVVLNVLLASVLLLLSKWLARVAAVVQFVLSLFIFSYAYNLRTLPTLASIANGFGLLVETGSLFSYTHLPLLPLLLLSCVLKLFFIGKIRLPARRLRMSFLALFLVTWSGWLIFRLVSGDFTLKNAPGNFRNPAIREIQHVGYLTTWAVEFLQGNPAKARSIFAQTPCSAEAVRDLPVFSLGPRIHLLQVESLDYAGVGAKEEGREVAPVLTALSREALFLEMDGTKNLGSANSDYELLNGKVAEKEVLYYEYLMDFPDSLVLFLQRQGFETAVFHGLHGRYMSLRRIYRLMGFSRLYFKEELEKLGYKERPELFMDQIPDGPLLDFAATQARAAPGPFLHFIITITMHGHAPAEFSEGFSGHPYWNALSYFDAALGRYVEALETGDSLILYGDHQSYNGPKRTGTVPFLIYTKGKHLNHELPTPVVYTRCEMSHYLRALFEVSQKDFK